MVWRGRHCIMIGTAWPYSHLEAHSRGLGMNTTLLIWHTITSGFKWCSTQLLRSLGWWKIAKLKASCEPPEMNPSFPPGRPSHPQDLHKSCQEWIGRMTRIATTPAENQKGWDEHLPSPRTQLRKNKTKPPNHSLDSLVLVCKFNCHYRFCNCNLRTFQIIASSHSYISLKNWVLNAAK